MNRRSADIDSRRFWRLAAASVAMLVPLNWSWYAWARPIPGSLTLYVVIGSVAYLALLRWLTGVRWRDLSQDARFVMVSATLLLIVFLAFGRSGTYHRVFEQFVPRDARTPLFAFVYFAASSVILRFAVPYLLVRFKLREAPRDFCYVVPVSYTHLTLPTIKL